MSRWQQQQCDKRRGRLHTASHIREFGEVLSGYLDGKPCATATPAGRPRKSFGARTCGGMLGEMCDQMRTPCISAPSPPTPFLHPPLGPSHYLLPPAPHPRRQRAEITARRNCRPTNTTVQLSRWLQRQRGRMQRMSRGLMPVLPLASASIEATRLRGRACHNNQNRFVFNNSTAKPNLPLPPTPQVKQQPSRDTAAQCCRWAAMRRGGTFEIEVERGCAFENKQNRPR